MQYAKRDSVFLQRRGLVLAEHEPSRFESIGERGAVNPDTNPGRAKSSAGRLGPFVLIGPPRLLAILLRITKAPASGLPGSRFTFLCFPLCSLEAQRQAATFTVLLYLALFTDVP